MSEDIKLYRKDSPGGEEISDKLAIQEGYANKEEMAIDLVNNAGYSTSPVLLEDGSGISGGSAALANLTDAEGKVQSLIDEFLRNQGSKGVYDSPTAGEPVFTQEDEDNGLGIKDDIKVPGVKTILIKQVKAESAQELQKTDWYVVRKADTDEAIPSAVATHRAAVRSKQAEQETAITNASDTAALETLYTYTRQEDGSSTRPLGELPTLED